MSGSTPGARWPRRTLGRSRKDEISLEGESDESVGDQRTGGALALLDAVGPAHPTRTRPTSARARPACRSAPRRGAGRGPDGTNPRTGSDPGSPRATRSPDPGRHDRRACQAHDSATGHRSHAGDRLVQTIAPRSSIAWFQAHPSPSGTSRSASTWARRGRERLPGGASEDPADVGVDDSDVALEGEGQHRPRRVGTDPRQGEQRVEVVGQAAVVLLGHDGRRSGGGSRPDGCTRARPTPRRPRRRRPSHRRRRSGTVRGSGATGRSPGPPGSAGASAR